MTRNYTLACSSIAICLVSASVLDRRPRLMLNVSTSVPVGLYAIRSRSPQRGDIVALQLPELPSRLAHVRGYLPAKALLLKPVAAMPGDRVCRWHRHVLVNGRLQAVAALRDAAGRLLPVWYGCCSLRRHDVFVLSSRAGSFDSRYFGRLHRNAVIGIAQPLITF